MLVNFCLRSLLELKKEEAGAELDSSLCIYRNQDLPPSIQEGLKKLRMVPFFIRLKIDNLNALEVMIQLCFLLLTILSRWKTKNGTMLLYHLKKQLKKNLISNMKMSFMWCESKNLSRDQQKELVIIAILLWIVVCRSFRIWKLSIYFLFQTKKSTNW